MSDHINNPDEFFLHKSGLSAYKQCPLKFNYMYINQIHPERDESMVYGTEFHQAVRRFYYIVDVDVLFAYKTFSDRLNYLIRCIPEGYKPRVDKWLRTYAKMEAKRSIDFTTPEWFMPLDQERYYEVSSPCKYAGTIDRVDHYDDDYLIVLDYKTGKFHQWLISSLRQEMTLYAVILNNHPKSPVVETGKYVAYWGTIHPSTEQIMVEEIKPQTLTALFKNTSKIFDAVEKGEFHPKVGEHCDYCSFLHKCWKQDWYLKEAI